MDVITQIDSFIKARIYVKDPNAIPKGAKLIHGKHGGMYYETKKRGPKKEKPIAPNAPHFPDMDWPCGRGDRVIMDCGNLPPYYVRGVVKDFVETKWPDKEGNEVIVPALKLKEWGPYGEEYTIPAQYFKEVVKKKEPIMTFSLLTNKFAERTGASPALVKWYANECIKNKPNSYQAWNAFYGCMKDEKRKHDPDIDKYSRSPRVPYYNREYKAFLAQYKRAHPDRYPRKKHRKRSLNPIPELANVNLGTFKRVQKGLDTDVYENKHNKIRVTVDKRELQEKMHYYNIHRTFQVLDKFPAYSVSGLNVNIRSRRSAKKFFGRRAGRIAESTLANYDHGTINIFPTWRDSQISRSNEGIRFPMHRYDEILIHEVGHHIYHKLGYEYHSAEEAQKKASPLAFWRDIHDKYKNTSPTSYARQNLGEDFAESFVAYCTQSRIQEAQYPTHARKGKLFLDKPRRDFFDKYLAEFKGCQKQSQVKARTTESGKQMLARKKQAKEYEIKTGRKAHFI
jgi:hypothetical protein